MEKYALHVASARAYADRGNLQKSMRHAIRARELRASFGVNDAQKRGLDLMLSEVFGPRKPLIPLMPVGAAKAVRKGRPRGRPRSKFIEDEPERDTAYADSDVIQTADVTPLEEMGEYDEDESDSLSWDDVAGKAEFVIELLSAPPRQRQIAAGFGIERFLDVFFDELKELPCMQTYADEDESEDKELLVESDDAVLRAKGAIQLISDIKDVTRFIVWKAKKAGERQESNQEVDIHLDFLQLFAFSLIGAVQRKQDPSASSNADTLESLGAAENGDWRILKNLLASGNDAATFIANDSDRPEDRGRLRTLFHGANIGMSDDAETCGRRAYKRIVKYMSARASSVLSSTEKAAYVREWATKLTRVRRRQSGLLGAADEKLRLGGVAVHEVAVSHEARAAPRFVPVANDDQDERTSLSRFVQNDSHSWPLVGGTYQDYTSSMDPRHLSVAWIRKNEFKWLLEAGIGVERIKSMKKAYRGVIREYQRNFVYKMQGLQDDEDGMLTAEVDSAKLLRLYQSLELTLDEKEVVASFAAQKQFLDSDLQVSAGLGAIVAESTTRLTTSKRRSLCDALVSVFNHELDAGKYELQGLSTGLENQAERIHTAWPHIMRELDGKKSRKGPIRKQKAQRRAERANARLAKEAEAYVDDVDARRRRAMEAAYEATRLRREAEDVDSAVLAPLAAARLARRRAFEDYATQYMREAADAKVIGRAERASRRSK
jgi:hypothetical protein